MIPLLIVILWLVFGVMAISSLFYRRYRANQVLGVTLSKTHSQHPEVQKTIDSFTKACYAVVLLSVGCSFLLLIPAIGSYSEFFMLLLVVSNLFVHWLMIGNYQKKLMHIKEQNKWTYQRKKIVSVDLTVSREKGRSSISSVWVWLFLLFSFAPTAVWFLNADIRQSYPIGLSFIGPLCQLCTFFLYYQMKNQHSSIANEKSEKNLVYAQQEERINSISATLSSLAMLIFWILFSLSMLYTQNSLLVIAPLIFLIAALFIIARWQQNKMRKLEENFIGTLSESDENIQEQQSTWKWGCYYNPSDPRIFVPKRIASMGWTINIGRPIGKIFYFGIMILVFAVILFVAYGGLKDYQITVQGSEIMINAAMYDTTFEKEQVVSVSVIKQLPNGTRTNGYGGAKKSFGHFALKGYGNCMLYIYNHVNQYIVVQLKGNDPGYVFINDKTIEKTETLYQTISHWLSESE
ncbi:MAG: DUF5808 domain-containing protein [Oscillospiraceae bacterium]|nr:DUF5808 domain-containing protein [Oscillospiraceae bacterium]